MQGDSDDDMEDEDELVSDDAMEMDDDDEDLALDPIDATEPGRGDASSSTSAQEYNGIGESCHPNLSICWVLIIMSGNMPYHSVVQSHKL